MHLCAPLSLQLCRKIAGTSLTNATAYDWLTLGSLIKRRGKSSAGWKMHFRLISLIIWAAGKLCGDLVETAWPRCLVTKSAAQLELSCTVAANPPLEITPHTYKECNVCLKTCRVSVSEDVCDVRVSVSWSMLEHCYMQTCGHCPSWAFSYRCSECRLFHRSSVCNLLLSREIVYANEQVISYHPTTKFVPLSLVNLSEGSTVLGFVHTVQHQVNREIENLCSVKTQDVAARFARGAPWRSFAQANQFLATGFSINKSLHDNKGSHSHDSSSRKWRLSKRPSC